MPRARLVLVVFCLLVGSVAPVACAVSDDAESSETECLLGPTCAIVDASAPDGTATQVDAAPNVMHPDASAQGELLCGTGDCVPDDADSCATFRGDSDAAAADAAAPELPPQLADAASSSDASSDAGDAGSETGTLDAAAAPPMPPVQGYACRVTLGTPEPQRQCLPAGSGEAMAPCVEQTDCAAGLACVGEPGAAQCLHYCCSGIEICEAGSYCTARPLFSASLTLELTRDVPVCAPADNCSLGEPYPCAGDECVCQPGMACTVVRGDGTTSCVAPAMGREGESCPCAAGYFCAPTSRTCLQICELAEDGTRPCTSGLCQMTAGFPQGWGLCVGAVAER